MANLTRYLQVEADDNKIKVSATLSEVELLKLYNFDVICVSSKIQDRLVQNFYFKFLPRTQLGQIRFRDKSS